MSAKHDLLELMRDTAYGEPPGAPDRDEGWRAGLSHWAWDQRAVLRQHPWILRIPIITPPVLPNQVAWTEKGLRCLRGTGLDEAAKLSAILLVSIYVRETATLARDLDTIHGSDSTALQVMSSYGQLLAALTDAERFPAVRAVLDSGAFDDEDELDPQQDDEFVFGLERILDGIAVLVRAHA